MQSSILLKIDTLTTILLSLLVASYVLRSFLGMSLTQVSLSSEFVQKGLSSSLRSRWAQTKDLVGWYEVLVANQDRVPAQQYLRPETTQTINKVFVPILIHQMLTGPPK